MERYEVEHVASEAAKREFNRLKNQIDATLGARLGEVEAQIRDLQEAASQDALATAEIKANVQAIQDNTLNLKRVLQNIGEVTAATASALERHATGVTEPQHKKV